MHPDCTSGTQLLPPPRPGPGPQHLGLQVLVAQPPAPCLNPRGPGQVSGLLGLQMVPRSELLAQTPGDQGCHAGLGRVCVCVCVWGQNFPAQTDGAGLELQLPRGWLEWQRDSADVLGRDGQDLVGHSDHGSSAVLLPSPE